MSYKHYYKDYYKILGLERDASISDIKKAYRKFAHQYHPDASKTAATEELFKEVNEAYKILKNPAKRAAYDELRDKLDIDQWSSKLEKEWKSSQVTKTPPKIKKVFEVSLIWWFVSILFIISLFATVLKQFIKPILLILIIFLMLKDQGIELSRKSWFVVIMFVLFTFGVFFQSVTSPIILSLIVYLIFKKLLEW